MIVDAADSFAVTYMLSDACQATDKPLVSASVIGLTGYAGAFCGGGPISRGLSRGFDRWRDLRHGGRAGTAVAVLGGLQAHLALHLLLDLQPTALGRVVTFDAKRLAFGGFGFDGSPEPDAAVPFIAPAAVTADDLVVDLRGLDEAPVSPFAGAPGSMSTMSRNLSRNRRLHGALSCVVAAASARCGRRATSRAGSWQSRAGGLGLIFTEEDVMTEHTTDQTVLAHIEQLVAEEKKLYAKCEVSDAESERLGKINVELDRCRDLLRQRRGLPNTAAIPTRPRSARRGSWRTYKG